MKCYASNSLRIASSSNLEPDDTKSARDLRAAGSDIRFARYIVEVDPLSVLALYDALCSEHEAVSVRIFQRLQGFFDLFNRIFFRRFDADAVKDLVRVVMPLMPMVVPTAAVIIMIVVVMFVFMLMVVMMLVTAAAFLVMVVMVVVTTAACVIVIVMVRVRPVLLPNGAALRQSYRAFPLQPGSSYRPARPNLS